MAIQYGVLRADDAAVRAIEEAVRTAGGQQRCRTGSWPSTRWVSRC